jgi:hypothetical protein
MNFSEISNYDFTNSYTHSFKVYVGKEKVHDPPANMKVFTDLKKQSGILNKRYQLYINN